MNSESISAEGHWNTCYATSPVVSLYFFFSDRSAKVQPTSRNTQLQVKMKVHYSDQQILVLFILETKTRQTLKIPIEINSWFLESTEELKSNFL